MRTWLMSGALAMALGSVSGVVPAGAQTPPSCPPGYYLASDQLCYAVPAPVYAPPGYDVAPPVYEPPFVGDGFSIGIGLGGLGIGHGHRGGFHGGSRGGRGGGHRR